jgi:crotonobetainyl-CoA:carnitine CoA-transferase CaiB-like acyl-CoA transferase
VFADPQVRERDMVVSVEHPLLATLSLIANPIRFSDTPLTRYDAPPMLGEHTEVVLRELIGCTDEDIQALKQAKVI